MTIVVPGLPAIAGYERPLVPLRQPAGAVDIVRRDIEQHRALDVIVERMVSAEEQVDGVGVDLARLEAALHVEDRRLVPWVGQTVEPRRLQVVPLLLEELGRQGKPPTELRTHSATLEDVFVALTGRHLRDE